MRANDTQEVVQTLRERLEPVEHAYILPDSVEGLLPHARKAAVLLPLFEQEGELSLVFIRRGQRDVSGMKDLAYGETDR